MKIIKHFDFYILALVFLLSFIVIFFDGKIFKKQGEIKAYKQSKYVGIGVLVFTLAMFIIRMVYII